MSGRRSRDKGANGEREFASVAREHGLDAERTAQLQAGRVKGAPDVTIFTWPELHVEVKRDERLSVDAMVRQSIADAAAYTGEARTPVVAWRRNGGGRRAWRIDCPADHYLGLLAYLESVRADVAVLRDELAATVDALYSSKTSDQSATTTTEDA